MQKQENFLKNQAKNARKAKNTFWQAWHNRLKSKDRDEVLSRARKAGEMCIAVLLGLALSGGEMPMSTYPLGIALICGIYKYYAAAFAGALIGALSADIGKEYIFAYVAAFIIRLLMSLPRTSREADRDRERSNRSADEESGKLDGKGATWRYRARVLLLRALRLSADTPYVGIKEIISASGLRLIISVVGGFVAGLFLLISNEFSYYSLWTLFFLMLVCPIVSLMLSGVLDGGRCGALMGNISIAFAMLLCVISAGEGQIFGIMLSPMLALFFTLVSARSRGIAAGLFMAIGTGLGFDARFVPMLIMAVIAYMMLCEIRLSIAMATVAGVCIFWSYYFSDMASFVAVLPPSLIAIPLFLIFDKFTDKGEVRECEHKRENEYFAKSVSEESKNMAVRAKVSSLTEAFSSLSDSIRAISDKFSRPDALGLRAITDEGFRDVCEGCPNFDVCFGAEYDRTMEVSGKITSALHKKGHVAPSDLGEDFSHICVRKRKLCDKMNSLLAERTERFIRGEKMWAFASSYDDIKDILQDAVEAQPDEYECDTVMGGKVYEYLKSAGYYADGVVVCGKRCKRVMLKGISIKGGSHDESALSLCRGISDILGVNMIGPVFEVGDDGMLMLFSAKPKLSAICSSAVRAAFEGEMCDGGELRPFDDDIAERRSEESGDVTNYFITDSSYFYSLIADGMGSGHEAAFSAGICSMFCEKMLCAGNRSDITIRMLNNFLRAENSRRGTECSVTVDLFELDLMLGVASFIKSGASPTYILRGGEVYRIAAKTMPVGITKNPDIKVNKFDMRSGDLVLMMSDGVCGESDECEWIVEMLCGVRLPESAEACLYEGEKFTSALVEKIMTEAESKMRLSGRRDDISLSAVLIV